MTTGLFAKQYALVQSSRNVVLDFCGSFREGDYTKGVTFDGKSICQLHVHIANTYLGWIMTAAHKKTNMDRFKEMDYSSVRLIRNLFAEVDTIVIDFIRDNKENWTREVITEAHNQNFRVTTAQIFTHVITHEFHHKGQILMLARSMGYIPPDTDIIRLA